MGNAVVGQRDRVAAAVFLNRHGVVTARDDLERQARVDAGGQGDPMVLPMPSPAVA